MASIRSAHDRRTRPNTCDLRCILTRYRTCVRFLTMTIHHGGTPQMTPMNNAATQLVFGLMSGVEQSRPYAVGDVICRADGRRYLIETVSDNLDGGVYIC